MPLRRLLPSLQCSVSSLARPHPRAMGGSSLTPHGSTLLSRCERAAKPCAALSIKQEQPTATSSFLHSSPTGADHSTSMASATLPTVRHHLASSPLDTGSAVEEAEPTSLLPMRQREPWPSTSLLHQRSSSHRLARGTTHDRSASPLWHLWVCLICSPN